MLASLAQFFECRDNPQSQLFICTVTAGRELVGEQPHLNRQAGRISGPCLPDRFVEIREPFPGWVVSRQQARIQRRADFLPLAPEFGQIARHRHVLSAPEPVRQSDQPHHQINGSDR